MTPEEEAEFHFSCMVIHEASHAVVAHKLGLQLQAITLDRSGGGISLGDDVPENQDRMTGCAAGYIGEAWWLHLRYGLSWADAKEHCATHGSDHDQKALDRYERNGAGSKKRAIKQAEKLVRSEFHRIEEYAKRLKRRGELSPSEL